MTKQHLQLLHVYFRQDVKPPVGQKAAISHKAVEVGVEVDEIPEGLDRDHYPRHAIFFIQGVTEELLERLIGALAELPQKLSIKPEMGSEHLGDGKDILSVR